jgi:hypothetical protein
MGNKSQGTENDTTYNLQYQKKYQDEKMIGYHPPDTVRYLVPLNYLILLKTPNTATYLLAGHIILFSLDVETTIHGDQVATLLQNILRDVDNVGFPCSRLKQKQKRNFLTEGETFTYYIYERYYTYRTSLAVFLFLQNLRAEIMLRASHSISNLTCVYAHKRVDLYILKKHQCSETTILYLFFCHGG